MAEIEELREKALKELETAETPEALETWRIAYIGRKGAVPALLKSLAEKTPEEKRTLGPTANTLRTDLETAYEEKNKSLNAKRFTLNALDQTLPGIPPERGHLHPLTIVENDIRRIFSTMNFASVEGPELETEYYNFDALNIPKNHPARDMQDTLWVKSEKGLLMRTQTSPVQIRYMKEHLPPFQIISIGRVFRHEATDASHETNFHQCEGLMVGEHVSLAHFKWIITEFFKQFFNKDIKMRFRPSYFPFVEPGLEVDIRSPQSDWLEILGAGMVHPKVFEAVGYDPKKVQGFAFGMGLERLAMIKYGIPDIRLFYNGDMRFIQQF